MYPDETRKAIERMPPSVRAGEVARKVDLLIDHVSNLIRTHGNNQVILYSNVLSDQIPRSHGAHAFNDFQQSMFVNELTQLCALWDKPDLEKNSIPTAIALMSDPATLRHLYRNHIKRCHDRRGGVRILDERAPSPEEIELMYDMHLKCDLERTRQSFRKNLRIVFGLGKGAIDSDRLAHLSGYRDRFIAHNVDRDLDKKTSRGKPYANPNDAQAHRLLHTSCKVINAINYLTRDSGFSFDSSFEMAKRNAERLWHACTFDGIT